MEHISKHLVCSSLAAVMLLSSIPLETVSKETVSFGQSISACAESTVSGLTVSVKNEYTCTSNSIRINWEKTDGASGYRVYRKNDLTGQYEKVKTIKDPDKLTFKDKGLEAGKKYCYKVQAYRKLEDGSNEWGVLSAVKKTATKPQGTPKFKTTKVGWLWTELSWTQTECSGYAVEVYSGAEKKWKKAASVQDREITSCELFTYDLTMDPLFPMKFRIKAFSKDGSGNVYYSPAGTTSEEYRMDYIKEVSADSIKLLSSKAAAGKTSASSYELYNTQGSKTTKSTGYISSKDKAVLKKFADTHFKSGWTKAEKAAYTLNWINKNVKYASGGDLSKISGIGCAQAVFEKKLGQCIQYNGAMVEMMNYLGFDAALVKGYRGDPKGTKWQHYWGEITINKKTYLIETGCFQKDGEWQFLCRPYSEVSGYIKNNKLQNK